MFKVEPWVLEFPTLSFFLFLAFATMAAVSTLFASLMFVCWEFDGKMARGTALMALFAWIIYMVMTP